jgi:glutathione S-transferase
MSYILYGSKTSPFVRRTRMLMEKIPYEFKEMNIFEGPDTETLKKINPINQVPVLTDGDKTIWDSRQIFNYLNQKHDLQKMDLKAENMLTALDGAMNAGVAMILMKRSGVDLNQPMMYLQRQKDRIESILDFVTPELQSPTFKTWNMNSMTLYSLLDWGTFRELFRISQRPAMQDFLKLHADKPIVKTTNPRLL